MALLLSHALRFVISLVLTQVSPTRIGVVSRNSTFAMHVAQTRERLGRPAIQRPTLLAPHNAQSLSHVRPLEAGANIAIHLHIPVHDQWQTQLPQDPSSGCRVYSSRIQVQQMTPGSLPQRAPKSMRTPLHSTCYPIGQMGKWVPRKSNPCAPIAQWLAETCPLPFRLSCHGTSGS